MFFDMSEFETQAIAIDQQYRTAVDALARRDDLTMPGKVTEAQRLEVQRRRGEHGAPVGSVFTAGYQDGGL